MGKLEAEAVVPVAEAAGHSYQHAGERPIANTQLVEGACTVLRSEQDRTRDREVGRSGCSSR